MSCDPFGGGKKRHRLGDCVVMVKPFKLDAPSVPVLFSRLLGLSVSSFNTRQDFAGRPPTRIVK